jgi:predicted nucleic acid-binding protein
MNIDMSNMYNVNQDDKVFIDTNILIFLFSPDFVSSKEYQIDKYSNIYGKLIENNCELFINSHVVSEFINKCLRIDFEKNFQDEEKTKDFKKDYRESQRYRDTLSLVLKQLEKFIEINVSQLDDDFKSFNIFEQYEENEKSDFNDLIIAKNVIDNKLKLLSDDGDFNNYEGINTNWYLN